MPLYSKLPPTKKGGPGAGSDVTTGSTSGWSNLVKPSSVGSKSGSDATTSEAKSAAPPPPIPRSLLASLRAKAAAAGIKQPHAKGSVERGKNVASARFETPAQPKSRPRAPTFPSPSTTTSTSVSASAASTAPTFTPPSPKSHLSSQSFTSSSSSSALIVKSPSRSSPSLSSKAAPSSPPQMDSSMLTSTEIRHEYDPARPNDYEEFCVRREFKEAEEKREKDNRELAKRLEEERRERRKREREKEKEKEAASKKNKTDSVVSAPEVYARRAKMKLDLKVSSGDEAYRRRLAMSQGNSLSSSSSPASASPASGGSAASSAVSLSSSHNNSKPRTPLGVDPKKRQENCRSHSYTPTKVVLLRNLVGRGQVDSLLQSETKSECQKYGPVSKVTIREEALPSVHDEEAVRIFVQYSNVASAKKAAAEMGGRFFAGRVVKATFVKEDNYIRGDLGL